MSSASASAPIIGHVPLSESVISTGMFRLVVGRKSTQGKKNWPRFHAVSNVNRPYMAIAPYAKLMTPEPL